jgi:uncharacterized protein
MAIAPQNGMGFDQYHEPPQELPQETRTFARMILSLIEEAQAIDWYEQRLAVEQNADARAIMQNAQKEEFKHFGMDLEFLLRTKPDWRTVLKAILFTDGDIVKRGEAAEKKVD